jgi:AraC family transcriptional regulator, arabinose operon regulatory protein
MAERLNGRCASLEPHMGLSGPGVHKEGLRVARTFASAANEEQLAAGYVVSPRCRFEARDISPSFYTILYLLEGHGTFQLGPGQTWELRPGALVQRFPGRVHTVLRSRDERWVEFFLILPGSLYRALTHCGTIDVAQPVLHPGLSRWAHLRLRALLRGLRPDSGVSAAQVLAEAHLLLTQLFDMDRERRQSGSETAIVHRARELLSRNLAQPVDMPSVAAELSVGYEKFRKLFRQHQGISPKEYRIRRRIDMAKHMLSVEQASIKEVASRLGYPDTPSFVKQFKRVAGVTPASFRRMA